MNSESESWGARGRRSPGTLATGAAAAIFAVRAELEVILSRAGVAEARRQTAVRQGDRDAETAALFALAELRRAYQAAVKTANDGASAEPSEA